MVPREGFPGKEINYTKGKFFVDTNLLVYAYDLSAGGKWKISSEILSSLWDHHTGITSTQVLQEFFVSLTQKGKNPLSLEGAKGIISDFLQWPLVVNDGKSILRAIDLQVRYRFSFWDSMIFQAAIAARADVLLSEDFQHGQVVESVTIINPFLK